MTEQVGGVRDQCAAGWVRRLVASHPPPNLPPLRGEVRWGGGLSPGREDALRKEWVLRWVGSCLRRNDGPARVPACAGMTEV